MNSPAFPENLYPVKKIDEAAKAFAPKESDFFNGACEALAAMPQIGPDDGSDAGWTAYRAGYALGEKLHDEERAGKDEPGTCSICGGEVRFGEHDPCPKLVADGVLDADGNKVGM